MCGGLFRMCSSRVRMIVFIGNCVLCCDNYLNTFLLFCLIGAQSIGMLLYVFYVFYVAVHRVSD